MIIKKLCESEKKYCDKKEIACSKVELAGEVAELKCEGLKVNATDTEIKPEDTKCVKGCKKAQQQLVKEQDKCKAGSIGCMPAIENYNTTNATAFLKKLLKIWDPLLRGLSKKEPEVAMYEDKSKETKKLLDAFDKRFFTIKNIKHEDMNKFTEELLKKW